jgi:cystathionine gamma-synthase
LKQTWTAGFEDNYWAEDAIFMERNSRDFVSRIDRINTNAEAICDVLRSDQRGKDGQRISGFMGFQGG